MLSGIRNKIKRRIFKDSPDNIKTPVSPIVLSRGTWLFVVIVPLFLWAVTLLLWAQRDMDRLILAGHNAMRLNKAVVGVFRSASAYGMSFTIFIFLIYLALSTKFKQLKGVYTVYLLIIFSYGLGGITGDLMKEVFDRPRPFVEYPAQITSLSQPPTPSLPSGHATKSMALAIPFVVFVSNVPRWNMLFKAAVLLAAMAVGYARIVLGVHYVSDVLAGMAVAIGCLPLEVWATNKICKRITRERLNVLIKVWAAILFFLMLYLLKLS
ncbi:phosphatase PAP2 family protein [Planctomycetota bacterium]